MEPKFVILSGLSIYDGAGKKCKLAGATVAVDFGEDNSDDATRTTDSEGALGDEMVSSNHATVTITVSHTGYQTVAAESAITWVGSVGVLDLVSINLLPGV